MARRVRATYTSTCRDKWPIRPKSVMRGLDPRTRITVCLSAADSRTGPRVKPVDDVWANAGVLPMMDVGLGHYLVVSAILLVLGIFGIFLNRKNVIVILMSIELILLAVNLNFVAFSAALNDLAGQVMAMFVLTVAAAEAAIGLAIVVIYFRNRGSIQVEDVNLMKG
jgi:NADH-quinone oxidoreductase subunit K